VFFALLQLNYNLQQSYYWGRFDFYGWWQTRAYIRNIFQYECKKAFVGRH